MPKAIIFGAGSTGRHYFDEISKHYKVVAFLDNDNSKWGLMVRGVPVLGDASICNRIAFDKVFVCSLPAMEIIKTQLLEAGVPETKISIDYVFSQVKARETFIIDFASIFSEEASHYSVAEGGVYQGEFSKIINGCFPQSKLFLFDTFEGFDIRDTMIEREFDFSIMSEKHMNNTCVDLVISKLPHKNNAIIRKGFFPETTKGLEKELFFFVNIDFDLYKPTLEGLRFFYPRLAECGCILVHDYFNPGYKGIKQAIIDYSNERGIKLKLFPIGDHCSVGIMK